jgi:hypothetical protein
VRPLAETVLLNWRSFHPHYKSFTGRKDGWLRIFSCWPREVAFALAGVDIRPTNVDADIEQALQSLKISGQLLDEIIADHLQRKVGALHTQASQLLWELSSRCSEPKRGTSSELIQLLNNNHLPDGHPEIPTAEQRDRLNKLAGSIPKLKLPNELWGQAEQAWQIQFLFELLPKADYPPTVSQLAQLAGDRVWLRRHLSQEGVHARRKVYCKVAAAEFYELPYPKDWRPEFTETVLWAAFKNVPREKQGDLEKALLTYGDSLDKRVDCAVKYLKEELDRTKEAGHINVVNILKRVTRAVIVPPVRRRNFKIEDIEALFLHFEQEDASRFGILFKMWISPGELRAVKEYSPLLKKLWKLDAVEVLKEVRLATEPSR